MASQLDFRSLDEGLGGQHRKRKRENPPLPDFHGCPSSMDLDHHLPSPKRPALGSDRPSFGRPTFDGVVAGKVSGRKWKLPKTSRASSMKISHNKPTLEQRTVQKRIKKAYQERKAELKEQIRQNKINKRKQKEEREKRKKENELRTGTVYQKISNPQKLKKMSKKQKKSLRVIPE